MKTLSASLAAPSLAAFAFVLLVDSAANAAGPVELTPHVGIQVGGFSTEGDRDADLETGVSYGAALDYRLLPFAFLRFSYHRQETTLSIREPIQDAGQRDDVLNAASIPLSQGHLLLGGTYEHGFGRIRGILGAGLGATHFTPRQTGYDSEWYFASAFEAALKIGIIENLGARIHTRLLLAVMNQGSELFCPEPNATCSYNFGSDVLAQGEFGAGVWMAF